MLSVDQINFGDSRNLPSTITEPKTFIDWPHNPDWVELTFNI
jgi:hypothetical protein